MPDQLNGRAGVTFSAVVTDIRLESRTSGGARWHMALSETDFREGDMGTLRAESRSGTRLEVPVIAVVVDDEGDLWHVVEKPLAAGTDVTGQVAV